MKLVVLEKVEMANPVKYIILKKTKYWHQILASQLDTIKGKARWNHIKDSASETIHSLKDKISRYCAKRWFCILD